MSALLGTRCLFSAFQFGNILVRSTFKQRPLNVARFFWRPRTRTYKTRKWKLGMSLIGGGLFCLSLPILKSDHELFRIRNQVPEESIIERGPYDILISRKVDGPNKLKVKLTLFQYQTCPFCCKVRAFLDYYGIPYNVVEVSPVFRSQLHFSEYKKVPILILEQKSKHYKQLNDSSAIISMLGTYLLDPEQNFDDIIEKYPLIVADQGSKKEKEIMNCYNVMFGEHDPPDKSFDDIKEETKWRKWTDEVLVHTLSPNIYRTLKESYESFCYFSEIGNWKSYFTYLERTIVIIVGSAAMYLVGKRLKSKYGLEEDVRESLYRQCRLWLKAVGTNQFRGGDRPDLSDLAVFGALSSIEGCRAFRDLLDRTELAGWYYATRRAVAEHAGSPR